uniref:hypothetical protein n=1 Tax=Acinetobacter guillouiae TaxID=106649 RepID=UPI00125FCFE6
IFFTTNLEFSNGAGNHISQVEIDEKANILHTILNYDFSEQLRLNLCKKDPMFNSLLNSYPQRWHNGWKDGSVLRPIIHHNTYASNKYDSYLNTYSRMYNWEAAKFAAAQLLTRELIELICNEAKSMGFDGIYGHEIDRWIKNNEVIAQPWLCIFNKEIISQPCWIS